MSIKVRVCILELSRVPPTGFKIEESLKRQIKSVNIFSICHTKCEYPQLECMWWRGVPIRQSFLSPAKYQGSPPTRPSPSFKTDPYWLHWLLDHPWCRPFIIHGFYSLYATPILESIIAIRQLLKPKLHDYNSLYSTPIIYSKL